MVAMLGAVPGARHPDLATESCRDPPGTHGVRLGVVGWSFDAVASRAK
jgi:hypothetical protein